MKGWERTSMTSGNLLHDVLDLIGKAELQIALGIDLNCYILGKLIENNFATPFCPWRARFQELPQVASCLIKPRNNSRFNSLISKNNHGKNIL